MFVPETTSRPPEGLEIPQEGQLIFTVLTQIPFLFTLFIGVSNLRKRDPTALLFALGGLIASGMEPIVDVMGFCYFPRKGNWIAFESHNRPIPLFVPGTYSWFVGGQGYWYLTMLRNPQTTRSDVWWIWLRAWIANLFLEYPALYIGMYVYYGYQPLSVYGFPLWFPAMHAFSPLLAACIIHLLTPELVGWKNLSIPLIVSAAYGMANAGLGWPIWVALSLDTRYEASYAGAAVSIVSLVVGIWVLSMVVPDKSRQKTKQI